jgi:signal transduction histidine kinase
MKVLHKDHWAKWAIILAVFCLLLAMFKLLFEVKYQSVVADKRAELQMVAGNLELQLNYRLMALEMLSTDPEIISMEPEKIRQELQRAVHNMGFFNSVVIDPSGHFIAEGNAERHISQVYDWPSFEQAAQGNSVISGRIVYQDIQTAYVSLRVPIIRADGQVVGVLLAGLPISKIDQFAEQRISTKEEYIFVLDNHAQFITHPQLVNIYPENNSYQKYKDLFFKDRSGEVFSFAVANGVEKLYLYTAIDHAEWRVVKAIPKSVLYLLVIRSMLPDLALILLLIMVIALGYRVISQAQRYRTERENMRVDRLATVSLVAAGLAHEIRNPLTAIKGFVQLMSRKPDQPVQPAHLHIMLTEIERIERLTNEFRMLARPPRPPQYKFIDLIPVIRDVLLLIDRQAADRGASITFQVEAAGQNRLFWPLFVDADCAPEDFFKVRGDDGQIKQVLLNLLRNAIEATGTDGRIQVSIKKDEQYVIVDVQDSGGGIAPEILTQIGTPFFTTKESGTGLGLSLCFSIIQQHGGKIEINSVLNRGTIVTIRLPKANEP